MERILLGGHVTPISWAKIHHQDVPSRGYVEYPWIFHSNASKAINYLLPPLKLPRLSLPSSINQIVTLADDPFPYSTTSLSLNLLILLTLIAFDKVCDNKILINKECSVD